MDRETVITHLQIIRTWAKFAREHDLQFFTAKHLEDIAKWTDDAIELMKEQGDKKTISDAIHETAKQFRRTIVRCRYCKYRSFYCTEATDGTTLYECHHPCANSVPRPGDWFCADGERRTD